MRKHKVYCISLLVCFVALSGCDKDEDTGTTGPGASGLSAETYMPLKIGATWTHVTTGIDHGEAFKDTTTSTNVGTITKNDKTYFIMFESDVEDSVYMRIENNIFYVYIAVIGDEFHDIPYLNFNKEAGQTWELFSGSFEPDKGVSGTLTWSGKFLGTDTITVPAGTFTNCVKFETVTTVISESIEVKELIWLAPNIGSVKSTSETKKDSEVIEISTEELIHYSIP
ncbi:hypothetical protein ACFL55_02575 [Candidatus Latescibacterota bacterium]